MNINGINLNLLRNFAAIYEWKTLSKAAQQIGLSQPALSHSLRQMRELFEDELFVREDGKFKPTRKARELAPPIMQALGSLAETLERPVKFEPKNCDRTFRLGLSDFGSETILPLVAERLIVEAPNASCVVLQLHQGQIPQRFNLGDIDLSLMSRQSSCDEFDSETVLQESVVCLMRESEIFEEENFDLNAYASKGHVAVNLTGKLKSMVDAKLDVLGFERDVRMVVPYFNAVPEIVLRTGLFGLLPSRLAMQACEKYPLKSLPLPFEFPNMEFRLYWHPRRRREAELSWFRQIVSEVCLQL